MAAAAILEFYVMWIWLFRRVDSVVYVLGTKFGSNISYSHWDRRTYASDGHLMTSRELTSGFDFWSRGHLHMASMHIPIKYKADIFIQSRVIDIFSTFGHVVISAWTWCSFLWNLVQISLSMPELLTFFPKFQDGGRRHLGILCYVNLAISASW